MRQLKEIRFFKKINQHQLALLSQVHQSRISLIENGLVEPTEDEKKKIAKALGVEVEMLWKKD